MIGRFRDARGTVEVVVYTREGCGLCRQAERLVEREARGARIIHVDIDTDQALVTRYGVRVPVIAVDDREVAELQVAPGQVAAAVSDAVRTARRTRRR